MKNTLIFLLFSVLTLIIYACDIDKEGSDQLLEPEISEIITDYEGKAVSGKPVTLIGANFSTVVSENKVICGVGPNAASLGVEESSDTRIVFIAPKIDAEQLKIRVSVKGKESNQVTLTYDHSFQGGSDAEDPVVDLSQMLNAATKTVVRPGVEWISFHGVWEGEIRNINIVKTTLNSHNHLGIYYEYGEADDYITKKCECLDALVGTNGPMACCHYVRVDGVTMRNANKQDPWIVNCALTIDNGVPDIVKVNNNYEAAALTNQNVGTGGPMLVFDGKIQDYPDWIEEDFLKTAHPRTAFGISKDRKTVFQVAVDGRWTGETADKTAVGMEIPSLARLMKGLGCHKAMNFDGGGGTAMWIYGMGVNGIVNHPCDAPQDWDDPTLRTCGNAIYIYSSLK